MYKVNDLKIYDENNLMQMQFALFHEGNNISKKVFHELIDYYSIGVRGFVWHNVHPLFEVCLENDLIMVREKMGQLPGNSRSLDYVPLLLAKMAVIDQTEAEMFSNVYRISPAVMARYASA